MILDYMKKRKHKKKRIKEKIKRTLRWREKATRQFFIFLPIENARIRIRLMENEKDKLRNFIVQLEYNEKRFLKGVWKPVVRYNNYHGYAHRDRFDKNGKLIDKKELGHIANFEETVKWAEKDLKANYKDYITRFLRV